MFAAILARNHWLLWQGWYCNTCGGLFVVPIDSTTSQSHIETVRLHPYRSGLTGLTLPSTCTMHAIFDVISERMGYALCQTVYASVFLLLFSTFQHSEYCSTCDRKQKLK